LILMPDVLNARRFFLKIKDVDAPFFPAQCWTSMELSRSLLPLEGRRIYRRLRFMCSKVAMRLSRRRNGRERLLLFNDVFSSSASSSALPTIQFDDFAPSKKRNTTHSSPALPRTHTHTIGEKFTSWVEASEFAKTIDKGAFFFVCFWID